MNAAFVQNMIYITENELAGCAR